MKILEQVIQRVNRQNLANARVMIENRAVLLILARVVVPQPQIRATYKLRIAKNDPGFVLTPR